MPEAVQGASRSVFFQAEDVLRQGPAQAVEAGHQWAGGKLQVWKPAQPGDELTLEFPVETAGKYFLAVVARQDRAAGKVSFRLNDQPLVLHRQRDGVNLHEPHRILSRALGSEDLELALGTQRLTVRYERPAAGQTNPEIGLDFLWLRKRP